MDVTVTESQLKLVLDKLDGVRLELLRLRAMLLPEEELSGKKKRELERARKEIAEGSGVNLRDLIRAKLYGESRGKLGKDLRKLQFLLQNSECTHDCECNKCEV